MAVSEKKSGKAGFDDILCTVGEWGRWQMLIFCLMGVVGLPTACHNLAVVFLAADPDHHCAIPEFNATSLTLTPLSNSSTNLTKSFGADDWLKFWIPMKSTEDEYPPTLRLSKCERFENPEDGAYHQFVSTLSQQSTKANLTILSDFTNLTYPFNKTSETSTKYRKIAKCDSWVYDQSEIKSSIVSKWNLVCDRGWMRATAQSIYMVGFMVGAVGCGALSDRFGRVKMLLVCIAFEVVTGVVTAFAPEYWSFVFLRMLVGMCAGGSFTIAFVVVMESIGVNHRMIPGIFMQAWFALGFMILPGIAYFIRDYFTLQLVISAPVGLILCYYWIADESPRWLLSQGKLKEADAIINKAAKMNGNTLTESLVFSKRFEVEYGNKSALTEDRRYTFIDLVRYPNMRKKSFNIFFNWFVNSLVYYGLSLGSGSLAGNMYLNVFLSAAVEIPGYILAAVVLDRIGRRWPLTGSLVIGGVACLITTAIPRDLKVLMIICTLIGKLAIATSFAIIYVFSAEQFPTVIRNVGVGAGSMCARVGSLIAPFVADLNKIWGPLPYLIFGITSVIAGILALLLPETLHHRLPDTIIEGENFGKYRELSFKNLLAFKQVHSSSDESETAASDSSECIPKLKEEEVKFSLEGNERDTEEFSPV
ncbi:organic cation transporter protein isoform X1 [Lingula anatina]|uniref:Organic cation transporter protein isoform X1 n=1 Tax=Lingula anatina TaxID=7574 RepID=A0A1S3JR13_LINAN|nr:organic cation transporter protein isoform X1 [Lingula anatina]|eukprot:XP_013412424.1 organic cation transporter protein isoform X1 [Lingula anatina]